MAHNCIDIPVSFAPTPRNSWDRRQSQFGALRRRFTRFSVDLLRLYVHWCKIARFQSPNKFCLVLMPVGDVHFKENGLARQKDEDALKGTHIWRKMLSANDPRELYTYNALHINRANDENRQNTRYTLLWLRKLFRSGDESYNRSMIVLITLFSFLFLSEQQQLIRLNCRPRVISYAVRM